MKDIYLTITLGLLATAGCNRQQKPGPAAQTRPGMGMVLDTSQTERRPRGPDRTGMILMMQRHIDSMAVMSPEQMSRVMARHDRMMSQMLDQMGVEMRQMPVPKGWNALTDSVKQDLAELPSLSGQALSSRMHAHANRVRRLIGMHKQMMLGM